MSADEGALVPGNDTSKPDILLTGEEGTGGSAGGFKRLDIVLSLSESSSFLLEVPSL